MVRREEKATGNVYVKNACLVNLVELMAFMHYIGVDHVFIISKI